jgi:dTDP-4-dehydrorhamnose 3,5-epimerase-like enzyme
MKKSLISTIFVFVSLLIMLSLFAACEAKDPIKQIASEYAQIREQIERGNSTTEGSENKSGSDKTEGERDNALSYANLFDKIADGEVEKEKEYAQLLRTITENTIEFGDNEVFIVAGDLAKMYSDMSEGSNDFGVQEIKVVENSSKELVLIIDYIDVRGYSVRTIYEDEMEYSGERLVEYDGSLGKHRIEITFYESSASARFAKQYPLWNAHELKEVPADLRVKLKCKGVYSPDHAFVLYIGSDEPISINEQDFTRLNRPIGSIELMIKSKMF